MPNVVENICSMYADDTKVYGPARNLQECKSIQKDLDSLTSWAQKWQLKFNADKCKVLQLGNKNAKHLYCMKTNGNNAGTKLENSDVEKDLGVYVDNGLNFSKHVEIQVNKANRILGLIRRSYEYIDIETMKLLFTSLVRPHLEFANSVWSPRYVKDKVLIEGVLRRATKCVPGLSHLQYEDRLKKMKIPSMSFRRIRGDLIEVFKFMHNMYNCKNPFEISSNPTRGHNLKLQKHFCITSLRQKFFTNRVIGTWNMLEYETVNAGTVNTFKNHLDKVFKDYVYCASVSHPLVPLTLTSILI